MACQMPSNTFINKTTNGVEFRESPTGAWDGNSERLILPTCCLSVEMCRGKPGWRVLPGLRLPKQNPSDTKQYPSDTRTHTHISKDAKALDENQLYNIFSGLSLTCQKIRKIRFPIKEPHPNLYLKSPCSGPPATRATPGPSIAVRSARPW